MSPRVFASPILLLALSVVALAFVSSPVAGQSCWQCCDSLDCSGKCVLDSCTYSSYSCHCQLAPGVIAGIVIGSFAVLVICIFLCRRRYIRQRLYYAQQPTLVYAQPPPVTYVAQPYGQPAPYGQPVAYAAAPPPQYPQSYQQPQQQAGTYAAMP